MYKSNLLFLDFAFVYEKLIYFDKYIILHIF